MGQGKGFGRTCHGQRLTQLGELAPRAGSVGGPGPHSPWPWVQVEDSYPGQERWLRDYCASSLYTLTLLEAFGFSEETWANIEFQKQVTTSQPWPICPRDWGLWGSYSAAPQPSAALYPAGWWH